MADPLQGPTKARAFGGDRRSKDPFTAGLKIKRIQAQLQLHSSSTDASPETLETRIVLNDFAPTGVKAHVPRGLRIGQLVTLNLEYPTTLTIKGRVRLCQDQSHQSRTISSSPYTHWIWIDFDLSAGAEETLLKDFCKDLATSHLGGFLPGLPQAPSDPPPNGSTPGTVDTSMMEAPNLNAGKASAA